MKITLFASLVFYLVLGDAASKLETFVWIFNYVFKSVNSSLFDLKASNKLGQMANHNVIFHLIVSINRLVEI